MGKAADYNIVPAGSRGVTGVWRKYEVGSGGVGASEEGRRGR